jgi:predicted HD phosphohydrolase
MRVKNILTQKKNVIYDACNISYKRRRALLCDLKKIACKKVCYIVATPYEICLKQNLLRERQVSEYVIKKMYMTLYIPQYYEGWNEIKIYDNFKPKDFDLNILFNGDEGLNKIKQDNPHHELTIGEHCLKCSAELEQLSEGESIELFEAALLHDIGKSFTKVFKNSKGEDTDIAHYYQHHLVSAYNSLFYEIDCDRTLRANYIQWHMQPFFIETEKAKNKFINLVGQITYNKIMLLHKADIAAH